MHQDVIFKLLHVANCFTSGCKQYSNSLTFSLHLFKATLQVFQTCDLVVELRQPRLRCLEVKFKVDGRATDGGTVSGREGTTRGQLTTETLLNYAKVTKCFKPLTFYNQKCLFHLPSGTTVPIYFTTICSDDNPHIMCDEPNPHIFN